MIEDEAVYIKTTSGELAATIRKEPAVTSIPTPTIPDAQIVNKRDGVGTFGLYVDFVRCTSTGKLYTQERRFLVQNLLCTYTRNRGDKRAAWRAYKFPHHDEARAALVKALDRHANQVELVHTPLLVEMTESDMASIAKDDAPYGRFAGVVATEKAVGKIDDETWKAKAVAS